MPKGKEGRKDEYCLGRLIVACKKTLMMILGTVRITVPVAAVLRDNMRKGTRV